MSLYTEDDLRSALRSEALAEGAVADLWPDIRRGIVRRRRVRRLGAGMAAVALVATAVGASLVLSGPPRRVPPAPVRRHIALIQPASYQAACAAEPSSCAPGSSGAIPRSLYRPLNLPRVGAGGACPASQGTMSSNPYVGGLQFGAGPVYMEIGNEGSVSEGKVTLGTTQVRGWFAMENVWLSLPSYQGPVVVRGKRLDGSGTLAFGGSRPAESAFAVPPGPNPNGANGYRFPPGSVWVTAPGCYGLQIDGTTFSETVILEALPPSQASKASQASQASQ
jgi:hypothetical protein